MFPLWPMELKARAKRVRAVQCAAHLEFVAHADEAEFACLLLGVLGVVGVLKEFAHEAVFGFTDQTLQGHVQRVVILLHKLGLIISERVQDKKTKRHTDRLGL